MTTAQYNNGPIEKFWFDLQKNSCPIAPSIQQALITGLLASGHTPSYPLIVDHTELNLGLLSIKRALR